MRGLAFNRPMIGDGIGIVLASYHNPKSITWRWAIYWRPVYLGWCWKRLRYNTGREWIIGTRWGEFRWHTQRAVWHENEPAAEGKHE